MKRILFTILCLFTFIGIKAQTPTEPPEVVEIVEPAVKVDTSERAPTFPGGEKQLMQYLKKNQRSLSNSEMHGRVIVSFIIEKDGSVTETKVMRTLSDDADAEAIRLIKKMPKWNPGIQNNNPVRVMYSIPISF